MLPHGRAAAAASPTMQCGSDAAPRCQRVMFDSPSKLEDSNASCRGSRITEPRTFRRSSLTSGAATPSPKLKKRLTRKGTGRQKVTEEKRSLCLIPGIALQLRLQDRGRGISELMQNHNLIPFDVIGPDSAYEFLEVFLFPSKEQSARGHAPQLAKKKSSHGSSCPPLLSKRRTSHGSAAQAFRSHKSLTGHMSGYLAPLAKITLDDETRRAAGIPLEASYFAFAYPIESLKYDMERLLPVAPADPWLFFLLLGGFVYLDEEGGIVSLTAVAVDDQVKTLFLHGPFVADEQAIAALSSRGRLRAVTSQPLQEAGFISFAWVNPSEEIVRV